MIGFGEIILMLVIFLQIRKGYSKISHLSFSKFWVFFLLACCLGLLNNIFDSMNIVTRMKGVFTDFFAYIIVFMTVYMLESKIRKNDLEVEPFLKRTFYYFSIIYGTLFLVSFFAPSFLGYNLRSYGRFMPLVNNIHHGAMMFSVLVFIGIWVMENAKGKIKKGITFLFVILFILMTLQTGSFKAFLGVVLGLGLMFYVKIISFFKGKMKKAVIFSFIITIAFVVVFKLDFIYNKLTAIFSEEDGGGAREHLYRTALKIGEENFLFGNGPGPHIFNNGIYWDAHQTLLTAYLQAGIVGVIILIFFATRFMIYLFKKSVFLAAFIPIFLYVLGGDILRRIPVWFFLVLIYYCNKVIEKKKYYKNESSYII